MGNSPQAIHPTHTPAVLQLSHPKGLTMNTTHHIQPNGKTTTPSNASITHIISGNADINDYSARRLVGLGKNQPTKPQHIAKLLKFTAWQHRIKTGEELKLYARLTTHLNHCTTAAPTSTYISLLFYTSPSNSDYLGLAITDTINDATDDYSQNRKLLAASGNTFEVAHLAYSTDSDKIEVPLNLDAPVPNK